MIDIIISKDMIPVLVTLFVLALVTLVTIAYVSRERFFIPVFIIIPTIFFCVYISWATISNLLGFPVARWLYLFRSSFCQQSMHPLPWCLRSPHA